jgi:hypothetical protein
MLAILVVARAPVGDLHTADVVLLGQLTKSEAQRYASSPRAVVDDLVACAAAHLEASAD